MVAVKIHGSDVKSFYMFSSVEIIDVSYIRKEV